MLCLWRDGSWRPPKPKAKDKARLPPSRLGRESGYKTHAPKPGYKPALSSRRDTTPRRPSLTRSIWTTADVLLATNPSSEPWLRSHMNPQTPAQQIRIPTSWYQQFPTLRDRQERATSQKEKSTGKTKKLTIRTAPSQPLWHPVYTLVSLVSWAPLLSLFPCPLALK